ncbi:MAG: GlsB/YeaQ/YmgE family stress response membrane protein [Dokdonella sp.]
MSAETLIIWLLVGAIAGWLAGLIVKGHGFGLVGNIIVGIVGAFLAGWLLPLAGLNIGGSAIVSAIIYAMIGAIVLLVLIGLIKRA